MLRALTKVFDVARSQGRPIWAYGVSTRTPANLNFLIGAGLRNFCVPPGELRTLLDALSYEGDITAGDTDFGVVNLVEGTGTAAADSNSVDGSLCRIPDGTDTDDASNDWAFTTTITPGVANVFSN